MHYVAIIITITSNTRFNYASPTINTLNPNRSAKDQDWFWNETEASMNRTKAESFMHYYSNAPMDRTFAEGIQE